MTDIESPPLQAVNVHRRYVVGDKTLHVLKGLQLTVRPGETVFLCGKSGAGKTTLLYVLGGLEKPTEGDVMLRGQSLYQATAKERSRMRNADMGFVFQHYFLLPELTALENVMLPAMIGGKDGRERAKELLSRVGLAERMEHLPAELSGGEQQRVAIARALVNDPRVLFADEPTGNLDAGTGGGVMDMLLEVVKESGKTLIVVTHDRQMALRGDRRLILQDGVLVEE
ncbi:MAG: ABC transporter ATP-binding protein [Verrucomicrobiaceae bacterium]|nr:ABC transporter ATP-binding protein [Verrucomicrobiaceae bacterium]